MKQKGFLFDIAEVFAIGILKIFLKTLKNTPNNFRSFTRRFVVAHKLNVLKHLRPRFTSGTNRLHNIHNLLQMKPPKTLPSLSAFRGKFDNDIFAISETMTV